jgi:hypothetical protein
MQLTFSDGDKTEPDWQPICVPDIEAVGGEVIPRGSFIALAIPAVITVLISRKPKQI